MSLAQIKIDELNLRRLAEKWRVSRLAFFGSVLRPDFTLESDVDVLVDFAPGVNWDLYDLVNMKEELEKIVGRPVDLVESSTVKNPFRLKTIRENLEVLYAA